MQQYDVDDELAALIERLAKRTPFENISFNDGLWRVMREHVLPPEKEYGAVTGNTLAELAARAEARLKKAASPSVAEWVASVPELKSKKGLTTWKAVCTLLKVNTAGDSARRKLKNWVKTHHPEWPPVPDID